MSFGLVKYVGLWVIGGIILLSSCRKELLYQKKLKPEISISNNDPRIQNPIIHLSKDTVYYIADNLNRDSGQTLSIEAGTLIKVNDLISITINPGATIDAQGSETEPIVFTSSAYRGVPGTGATGNSLPGRHYWYGIWIIGSNAGVASKSSGNLNFVRIEFAGGLSSGSRASLLLQNVSEETRIENIQVSYSYLNSSFEFSGGNCNGRNLVSYASTSSDFYLHQGYSGKLQNILAYRHPYFPDLQSDYFPLDNLAGILIQDPGTFPIISNATVLGPGLQTGTSLKYSETSSTFGTHRVAALVTLTSANFHIGNSVFLSFPKNGWFLDDYTTAQSIVDSVSDFTYSIMHCNDSARAFYLTSTAYPPATSNDFKNFMLEPRFHNEMFLEESDFQLTDPYNYDLKPNPFPKAGSPLLQGAVFEGVFADPFFTKVENRGALGTEDWLTTWTNFLPLQTNYNF